MSAAFPCRKCGHCCRQVGKVLAQVAETSLPGTVLHEAGAAFPYPVDAAGACSQLLNDGTCGVYDRRPLLCSVDDMFDALALPNLTRAEWHGLNAAMCPSE